MPFNRWTSIGHILQWQLGKIFPDRGMHGSRCVAFIRPYTRGASKSCWPGSAARPEILIIYCGHNEVSNAGRVQRATHATTSTNNCPRPGAGVVARVEAFSPLCGLMRENGGQVPGRRSRRRTGPPCRGRRTGLHDHRVHRASWLISAVGWRRPWSAMPRESSSAPAGFDLAAGQRHGI